ncbi:MAG: rRNA (adenine2503-C2)-methyltransferase [Tenuifilum sp.]|jgi:23S rRNA (adenine2503-C2)-methyltransferase|uniref:23S rRNA (adenine(2503)-C(2))-methyltransferase RlmN n=1 Tax=Tenuifilum sp. TaxID=2760880 RepID=UPI0024AA33D9|nr:23S rRNA (adenine(2503)-C(2))-methyltransferase RlmN [Tenuifilum sp.]MDI3526174.1 rRNA (adenine2503-C2)-methyltransferase [Tenuifilum sp.]
MQRSTNLIGLNIDEITDLLISAGFNGSYGNKISRWIYRKQVESLNEINDIPKRIVNEITDLNGDILSDIAFNRFPGADGSVRYLFTNAEGQNYESIFMDNGKRKTLCVSTQAGCRMGCKFCMTGSIGFRGNLSAGRIVEQLLAIPERKQVNRLVIMGMGEPFDNYDEVTKALDIFTADWGTALGKSNITLSTVGILNGLERFLKEPKCNLAISLHSPFPDERAHLLPSEHKNPINKVVALLKRYPIGKPLRLSFEYVALGGVNLSHEHAKAIAELLKGLKYHINIIPWNEHSAANYSQPTSEELNNFTRLLNQYGVPLTIRQSKGNEVGAACGQMAGKN